ncbi:hypothetical protein AYM40_06435 [Paraburkholderia phytofirmans OLGA172]|uniref:Uncharacterized protein n=1 Tax=Paraburkholderia phytofirmans OLGA172 TaxID=1417228 RepID=A0A160FJE9_9BURK|nr:hypothetical protein [Paraburkholderia phytofirmans]ANB72046.1 hypothetical protein AYM40_06435 [Paraburkholderia phytofirmans OLGA172]
MAASVDYNGAADAFQITFSTGYRVRFFIVNLLLLVLALFVLIATLIVAIRGGGLFGARWFWLPAALGVGALVLRRILIAGLTAPPIIIDRSGNVRRGFQHVQFRDRPAAILTGPAAEPDKPIGFQRRGVRLNSSITLVGPYGARFVIYTAKNVHTVRHIFGGVREWTGATNRVVPQTSVPAGRPLLFGLVAVGIVSIVGLLVLVSDYLLFYPAYIGVWALGASVLATACLIQFAVIVRRRNWPVQALRVPRVLRAAHTLLAGLSISCFAAMFFHLANLIEFRWTPGQLRTVQTFVLRTKTSTRGCGNPVYLLEPTLKREIRFCGTSSRNDWQAGQRVEIDEYVNKFGVRLIGMRALNVE